jgi:transposase
MKDPMFVRPLELEEKQRLEAGLRSRNAFVLRRCQILLASSQGYRPSRIAEALSCATSSVRNALHAFQKDGLTCLDLRSSAPKSPQFVWPRHRDEELRELVHQSPRNFGKKSSIWTLDLMAEVCFDLGFTERKLSGEAIRYTLARLRMNWKRAKNWMTSPDPNYVAKKARRDHLIRLSAKYPDWVLGFEDEVWWSRVAQPTVRVWTDGPPSKVQLLKSYRNDPDPDAICCYGFLRNDTHKVKLRLVEGRPLADLTIQYLDWLCSEMDREKKKVLIVVWDDASWHMAGVVANWVRDHNQEAKRKGMVRLVICELPVASPWLNNIEPCWTHAKKAIMELDRKLTAEEITGRVCDHFGCEPLPYLRSVPALEDDPVPF